MKLEDQLCSLQQAKELNDLGLPDPYFWWVKRRDIPWRIEHQRPTCEPFGFTLEDYYPAFSVPELGSFLSEDKGLIILDNTVFIAKLGSKTKACGTEAQARAALLLFSRQA